MEQVMPVARTVRTAGVDPKLNELNILATLNNETFHLSTDDYRSLCSLVLLACYDRKVEREFIVEVIETVTAVYSCIEAVELGISFVYFLSVVDPQRKPLLISGNLQLWVVELARLRKTLAGYMELLIECPSSSDLIS